MSLNTRRQRQVAFDNTDAEAIRRRQAELAADLAQRVLRRPVRARVDTGQPPRSTSQRRGRSQTRRRSQNRRRSQTRQSRRRLPTESHVGYELVHDPWLGRSPIENSNMKKLLTKLIKQTKNDENKVIFMQTISELNDNDRNHLSQLCTITIPTASEVNDGDNENLPVAAIVGIAGKKRKKRKKKKTKKKRNMKKLKAVFNASRFITRTKKRVKKRKLRKRKKSKKHKK